VAALLLPTSISRDVDAGFPIGTNAFALRHGGIENAVKRLVREVELPHNVLEGFSTLTTAEPPEKRATGYAS
jgi:hypothetical protein